MGGRRAAFLDRDGTIIADRDYPGDPDGVSLLPGAAEAIVRLNRAGLPVLLITNQSGIGRGYISEEDYQAVHARMVELLERQGARLDGAYYCPHSPDREPACDCRKPAPGLYLRAAEEHGVDVGSSFFIGDRVRDVLPGSRWGASGFLLEGTEPDSVADPPPGVRVVASLAQATDLLLAELAARIDPE